MMAGRSLIEQRTRNSNSMCRQRMVEAIVCGEAAADADHRGVVVGSKVEGLFGRLDVR